MANRRKRNEVAQAATASVPNEQNEHAVDDVALEIEALEKQADEDPSMRAAEQLLAFRMTPGASSLLDRAMDNLAENTGAGLPDEDAKAAVKMRGALVKAAGNDLSVVLTALVDSCDTPKEIAGTVYSMGYNVLKAAVFIANLDYRRYLDPKGDFDLTPYVVTNEHGKVVKSRGEDGVDPHFVEFDADQRYEDRSPPLGLADIKDRENEFFSLMYGDLCEDTQDVFARSLADLRLFLQLTCESFGWDAEAPMPYANVMELNGTFTPITDPQVALDHSEVKRKESLARRRQAELLRLGAAAERAKAAVQAALKRNK